MLHSYQIERLLLQYQFLLFLIPGNSALTFGTLLRNALHDLVLNSSCYNFLSGTKNALLKVFNERRTVSISSIRGLGFELQFI